VGRATIFPEDLGRTALAEDLQNMNARPEIRDALLVQRMKYWWLRARYSSIGNGCPKWRARKNFWALVRKYRTLAERHGFRETSVF
jgi:hypothetical protein